jgi:hypothetical protein
MQPIIDINTREELKELWQAVFLIEPPDDATWARWLGYYPPAVVRAGMIQLAIKHKRSLMVPDHMVRFASSVMGRLDRDRRTALEKLKIGAAPWAPSNVNATATATDTVTEGQEEINGNR